MQNTGFKYQVIDWKCYFKLTCLEKWAQSRHFSWVEQVWFINTQNRSLAARIVQFGSFGSDDDAYPVHFPRCCDERTCCGTSGPQNVRIQTRARQESWKWICLLFQLQFWRGVEEIEVFMRMAIKRSMWTLFCCLGDFTPYTIDATIGVFGCPPTIVKFPPPTSQNLELKQQIRIFGAD